MEDQRTGGSNFARKQHFGVLRAYYPLSLKSGGGGFPQTEGGIVPVGFKKHCEFRFGAWHQRRNNFRGARAAGETSGQPPKIIYFIMGTCQAQRLQV